MQYLALINHLSKKISLIYNFQNLKVREEKKIP
jgi:hypothetical protein